MAPKKKKRFGRLEREVLGSKQLLNNLVQRSVGTTNKRRNVILKASEERCSNKRKQKLYKADNNLLIPKF
jgi:predicted secreted protein